MEGAGDRVDPGQREPVASGSQMPHSAVEEDVGSGEPVVLAQVGDLPPQRAHGASRQQFKGSLPGQRERKVFGEFAQHETGVLEIDRMERQDQHARADALDAHAVFLQGKADLVGRPFAGVVVTQPGAQAAHGLAGRGIGQSHEILSAAEHILGHGDFVEQVRASFQSVTDQVCDEISKLFGAGEGFTFEQPRERPPNRGRPHL